MKKYLQKKSGLSALTSERERVSPGRISIYVISQTLLLLKLWTALFCFKSENVFFSLNLGRYAQYVEKQNKIIRVRFCWVIGINDHSTRSKSIMTTISKGTIGLLYCQLWSDTMIIEQGSRLIYNCVF